MYMNVKYSRSIPPHLHSTEFLHSCLQSAAMLIQALEYERKESEWKTKPTSSNTIDQPYFSSSGRGIVHAAMPSRLRSIGEELSWRKERKERRAERVSTYLQAWPPLNSGQLNDVYRSIKPSDCVTPGESTLTAGN